MFSLPFVNADADATHAVFSIYSFKDTCKQQMLSEKLPSTTRWKE